MGDLVCRGSADRMRGFGGRLGTPSGACQFWFNRGESGSWQKPTVCIDSSLPWQKLTVCPGLKAPKLIQIVKTCHFLAETDGLGSPNRQFLPRKAPIDTNRQFLPGWDGSKVDVVADVCPRPSRQANVPERSSRTEWGGFRLPTRS